MVRCSYREDLQFLNIILSSNSVNSISLAMLDELKSKLSSIDSFNSRCIVFSSDQKHFCAGADLKERSDFSYDETVAFLNSLNDLYSKIEALPIPTIALINGACLGGGLELALSCDFRIALKDSFYGFPETSIGIIPGAGGTQRMTRLVGPGISMKWIFSSDKYTYKQAMNDRVVDLVFDSQNSNKELNAFINKIIKNAPLSIKSAKKSINRAFIDYGLQFEREGYIKTLLSEDRSEGLRAFKNKDKPSWKGK
ncbi:MAG: enoyl-CoA hydratase [Candidatus Marinimicrobia bacterium]|nr:enoyl-CoA hydratase [Candidatus Neomarinimicrobiota bacterium]|tara:strand:- start:17672 stop:18430 length:759 start_codon:yes stop_codon:yes gene_type:complete